MEQELGWAGAVEITESDIALVAGLYNDTIGKIDPFRFHLDLNHGDFTLKPWCKDIISLIRWMNKIGAKPRLYIQSQVVEYKKPHGSSRQVPTLKMMASPAGMDRYKRFCERMGLNKVEVYKVSLEEMEDYSRVQMENIMKRRNIKSATDFFQDPYLVAQLSKSFVQKHPAFQELVREGYFKEPESIFP